MVACDLCEPAQRGVDEPAAKGPGLFVPDNCLGDLLGLPPDRLKLQGRRKRPKPCQKSAELLPGQQYTGRRLNRIRGDADVRRNA